MELAAQSGPHLQLVCRNSALVPARKLRIYKLSKFISLRQAEIVNTHQFRIMTGRCVLLAVKKETEIELPELATSAMP